MNIELLEKVKKAILEEPKRVDMSVWVAGKAVGGRLSKKVYPTPPKCGTVACIAGWACLLGSEKPLDSLWCQDQGMDVLRLSNEDEAWRLFHTDFWPNDLLGELSVATVGSQEYATVVARRIDRFIETDGKE